MTDNFNTILPSDFLDDITAETAENINRQVWTKIRTVKLGRVDKASVGVPLGESKNKSEVYFTETDDTGTGICINTKTEWLRDLQVKIGHPPDDKDRWHVQDIVVQNELEPVTNQPGVPPHSEDHSLRNVGIDGSTIVGKAGSDITFLDDRQQWNLGIFPFSGWQARIVNGWVMFDGKLQYYNGAILDDQTANVPAGANTAAYVLVELGVDLTLTYTKGAEFDWRFPGVDGFSQYVPVGADNTYKWVLLVRDDLTEFTYANIWTGLHFRQVHAPPIYSIAANANTSGPGIYEVDTSGGAITLTLDSDDAVAGRRVVVNDISDNAGTNVITIDTEGAETINGFASIEINTNSGSAELYSDGSNWYTDDGVTGNVQSWQVGISPDLLKIDEGGHLTLEGEATVWDDHLIPLTTTKLGGVRDPDFSKVIDNGAGSTGVYAFHFDKNTEEEVFFIAQFPHKWKEGSTVYPHVHWLPSDADTGVVRWGIEYSWASIGSVFGNSTLITGQEAATGSALDHMLTEIGSGIDATGKTHSSILLGRLYRDAGDGADTYDADAIGLDIDFHIEINQLGANDRPT